MRKRLFDRSGFMPIALMIGGLGCGMVGMSRAEAAGPEAVGFVKVTCPLTGPGIAACAATDVVLEEFIQALNGKQAFGLNGELMRVLAVPVHIVDGNIKGAERESGELAKVLRASSGISVRDINDYGIWGGPNSLFRKPFG